jgi:hypothetical protein
MCARPDSTDPRDRALARLAAETLKSQAATGQDCPDAALVAAYADHGLADDERLQLETHFLACERCQQTLAVLGASLDAAQLSTPVAAPAPVVAARSPKRWMWWLTPAFGAAAAALLWMALRPATPKPVEMAADYSRTAQSQPESAIRDEPAQNQKNVAQTPPAGGNGTVAPTPAAESAFVAGTSPDNVSRLDSEARAKAAADTLAESALAAAPAPRALAGAPPAPVPPAENQVATRQTQALSAARSAAPSAAPQSAVAGQLNGAPSQPVIRYTFTSPTGGATWRLGDAGSIARSIDGGRIWQPQPSGASEDLIAGSAMSDRVAWVVGRNRVILRTIDGQRWERITPPMDPTAQWSVIAAHDAMSATVIADDFRRFVTTDGGQTWSLEP